MLASMRYFLRFIELEEEFDKHGFEKKVCPDTMFLPHVNEKSHILLTTDCRSVRGHFQNH